MNHKPDQNANYAFTGSCLCSISASLSATKDPGMYCRPSTGSAFAFQFIALPFCPADHKPVEVEVFRSFTKVKIEVYSRSILLQVKVQNSKYYFKIHRVLK